MNPAFESIYQDFNRLYLGERTPEPPDQETWNSALKATRMAVQEASGVLDGRVLRPDGRLFLLTNLHHMVALPLLHPRSPVTLDAEVQAKLTDDARRILVAAGESAGNRVDIPASHVLWGAATVLETLNLKSWRIWERD